jgi:GxxExxY protein
VGVAKKIPAKIAFEQGHHQYKKEKREWGERGMETEKQGIDSLIYRVIGCMIEVHKQLGPGLLEKIYRRAITVEFERQGIRFEAENEIELQYKGDRIGTHRLDLFIENQLVVELKTVEELHKKHYAQVRSYLKAIHPPIGLLVNFAEFQLNARRVELNQQQ